MPLPMPLRMSLPLPMPPLPAQVSQPLPMPPLPAQVSQPLPMPQIRERGRRDFPPAERAAAAWMPAPPERWRPPLCLMPTSAHHISQLKRDTSNSRLNSSRPGNGRLNSSRPGNGRLNNRRSAVWRLMLLKATPSVNTGAITEWICSRREMPFR